eukprot:scaffold8360_cov286-Pinguiococcus_pyrenoidosus.AAC.3
MSFASGVAGLEPSLAFLLPLLPRACRSPKSPFVFKSRRASVDVALAITASGSGARCAVFLLSQESLGIKALCKRPFVRPLRNSWTARAAGGSASAVLLIAGAARRNRCPPMAAKDSETTAYSRLE